MQDESYAASSCGHCSVIESTEDRESSNKTDTTQHAATDRPRTRTLSPHSRDGASHSGGHAHRVWRQR
jgi:hypothetical protein